MKINGKTGKEDKLLKIFAVRCFLGKVSVGLQSDDLSPSED